jgi:hypothetical protein
VTTPRVRVPLYRGWREIEIPNAPTTYVRGDRANSGLLQFSQAHFRNGTLPNTNEQLLIGICEKITGGVRGQKEKSSHSGLCEFGIFGTVVIKADYPAHLQVWVISNELEFILVTHTCDKDPGPKKSPRPTKSR